MPPSPSPPAGILIPFTTILRLLSITTAIAQIVISVINENNHFPPNDFAGVKFLIDTIYQIILSLLAILVECRIMKLLTWFGFLLNYFGLSFFFILIGMISFDTEVKQLVVSIVWMSVGVIYLLFGLACKRMIKEVEGDDDESEKKGDDESVSGGAYQKL